MTRSIVEGVHVVQHVETGIEYHVVHDFYVLRHVDAVEWCGMFFLICLGVPNYLIP